MPEPCGCRDCLIKINELFIKNQDGSYQKEIRATEVIFCPLHASAERLLKALKSVRVMFEMYKGQKIVITDGINIQKVVAEAIEAAERKPE